LGNTSAGAALCEFEILLDIFLFIDEHEFVFMLNGKLFARGLLIWLGATLALRIAGQHLLHANGWTGILALFAPSFPLMAWLARRLCQRLHLPRERWLLGAMSLAMPTLLLDALSSAFFPRVFPNMQPQMAGVFGGWMLWCCAGAFAGVMLGRSADS
jgi:Family of unknown function (DUF5367)